MSSSANVPGMFVSIGAAESGIKRDPGREWSESDNFTGTMTESLIVTDTMGLPKGTYIRVNVEGHEDFYRDTDGALVNATGGYNNLACVGDLCTYTVKDGTIYEFNKAIRSGFSPYIPDTTNLSVLNETAYKKQKNIGLLIKITRPDGEIIEKKYIQYPAPWVPLGRQVASSVSSSLGWMIKYHYNNFSETLSTVSGERSVKAINTAVEYCEPGASPCNTLSNIWPTSRMIHSFTISSHSGAYVGADGLPVYTTYHSRSLTSSVFDALNNETKYKTSSNEVPGSSGASVMYTHPSGILYSYKIPGCTMNYGNGICYIEPNTGKISQLIIGHQATGDTYMFDYQYAFALGASKTITGPDGEFELWWSTGKPLSYTDNLNRKSKFTYDIYGNYADKLIDSDATPNISSATGGYSDYDYDSRGNITAITTYPKNGGTPLVISATYPSTCNNIKTCNKPSTITHQNGVTYTYTYGPDHGGVTSITKPSVNGIQAQINYTYEQKTPYVKNSSGTLVANAPVWRLVKISKCMTMTLDTCEDSEDEWVTEYSSFTNNLLPRVTTVRNGTSTISLATTTEYDIYGNISWVDGPRPGTYDRVYYFYDALRQRVGEIGTDPDGSGPLPRQAIRTSYNSDGKVESIEKGIVSGTTKTDFDSMLVNEQISTQYSDVHGLPEIERYFAGGTLKKITQTSYDNQLRVECVAQRMNRSAFNALPSSACTLGAAGDEGNDRITKYSYDLTGALLSVTSGYGTLLARVDRTNTYYSDNGLLETEADGKGNKTFYKYDTFKRLWKTVYPQATNGTLESSTDYTQKNYIAGSSLVSSMRLRDGLTINFSAYDEQARVTTKSGALSESFGYNNFDQIVSHTNNSTGGVSQTTNFIFNSLGWLKQESRTAAGVSLGSISYGYDGYGRRVRLTWPDNFYINYSYMTNGYAGDYLKTITQSDNALLASFDYHDNGLRKTLTRGNGVITSYDYNDLRQLTNLSTDVGGGTIDDIREYFGYTTAGQVKTRTSILNNTDYLYTNPSVKNVGYTSNALNQIASSNNVTFTYDGRGNLKTDDNGYSYTYNANNLLLNATKSGVTASLSYDAENRLYSITKSGTTIKFMYDGSDLIAETNSANIVTRRYVHGPGTDDPIVWFEGSGANDKRYYTYDRQGSILGITKSDGTSLMIGAYDEYGNQSNPGIGRFQYTGQTWLPEVGLYYYKARLYNPRFGRFMQTDPIGYKDGINWYAYVGNDPVNKIDPTGKIGWLIRGLFSKGLQQGAKQELKKEIKDEVKDEAKESIKEAPKNLELKPGTTQTVDPKKLSTDRKGLDKGRLDAQRELADKGVRRETNVKVDQTGKVIDGHHGTKAYSEYPGQKIDVDVIEVPGASPGSKLVKDLPIHGE